MSGTTTLNEKRNDLLKLLIASASSSSTVGLATEATLLNVFGVLSSLLAEQSIDFELKCIKDSLGDIYLLRITWDDSTAAYTVDYIDSTGAIATPVGATEFCSPDVILNSILTELQTLNTTDFATAANQALALTELQSIVSNTTGTATEATLASFFAAFSGTDFATETTLTSLAAEDFATEATLSTASGNILALLTSFNAEDFASETTLAAFSTAFGLTDFATETTLTALAAEDFSTEATQALVLAQLVALNALDFATETTLLAQAADVAKLVGFAITEFDEVDITYVLAGNGIGEISTVIYKLATVTLSTLTLTYNASNQLTNVLKS